ncbi:putative methyltransferase [Streptomyces sp. NBRC 110611]|uniref:class I SAM-dependent methyltransferase n=1 Tax=Streptomyces sp. NBRC 110611 TaxID=1621259 RepID=UPI00082B47D0|nr:class I SAM-dependent methyltransferase [Streptomyces sp. NBRC 110611]GAU67577.1 putative methyltransferase [Streptomyces sp. NBRC 110611]
MAASKVFTEFSEGLGTINSSDSGQGPDRAVSDRIKGATSSSYDMAATASSQGDIWNWGMHDDTLLREIRALVPGFADYDTDGYSEQLYFLALRDLPIGLAELAGASVLEVGCGLGEGLNFLSRLIDAERVTGLDLSPQAITRATTRLSRGRRLHFVQGDAENLPFEDGELDLVINIESSHTYPDFGRFLDEVARVLKPGGHFSHIDTFTAPRYAQMTRHKEESRGLAWIHERDISEEVRTSIRRRMTAGSHFQRTFAEKRMSPVARLVGRQVRRTIFGAKFAGFPDTALTKALKKAGAVPSLQGLPDSYRHHIARKG